MDWDTKTLILEVCSFKNLLPASTSHWNTKSQNPLAWKRSSKSPSTTLNLAHVPPRCTSRCLLHASRRHCWGRSTWFRRKIEWTDACFWAMQGIRACVVPRTSLDSLSPLWILLVMGLGSEYLIPYWPIQTNLSPSSWFLLLLEVKFCPTQRFSLWPQLWQWLIGIL